MPKNDKNQYSGLNTKLKTVKHCPNIEQITEKAKDKSFHLTIRKTFSKSFEK